jgi:N-acetylglutamate synthase-like GNAT family acetyltransferase
MQIVRARPSDAMTLTNIAIEAKRHWGYPEKWMANWHDALTIRSEQIEVDEVYCATDVDEIMGFYALHRDRDILCLEHLWVLPKKMGRGVGQALFEHSVERARALRFRSLHIESDPNAEGFYQRMGARRVGMNMTQLDGEQRELPVLIYEVPQLA